jgi:type I restriction enzyme S subunit
MELKKIHISDIGKIVTGKTPRTSVAENYDGYIPFLTPSDDLSHKSAPKTTKTLTEQGLNEVRNCLLPSRSICVSCIGSDLGKVVMTKEPTVTNQQFNSIISNKNFNADFVYYFMTLVGRELNYLSKTSTAVPIINKSSFSNYEIEVPDLETQNRIASILSSIDSKIELNRRINDNLEQQAQALFKAWFVDFEPFKDGEFVDDDFGRRPYGWNVKPLKYLVEKVKSGDWGKDEQMGNHTMRTFCMRGADFPDIKEGSKGKMPIRYILEKNFREKTLCDGNVVVEISGGSPTQSTGRIVLIDKTFIADCDNALICTNFCKSLEIKESFSLFFYLLWQYLYDKKVMFIYENGSNGLKNLNINSLLERELFVIPPKEIISRFNLVVSLLLSKKQANGIEISRLASLRDTLLPKLMSGNMSFDY